MTRDVNLDDHCALFVSFVTMPPDQSVGPADGASLTRITDFDWARYVATYVTSLQTPP